MKLIICCPVPCVAAVGADDGGDPANLNPPPPPPRPRPPVGALATLLVCSAGLVLGVPRDRPPRQSKKKHVLKGIHNGRKTFDMLWRKLCLLRK